MPIKLITGPAVEPVSISEVKTSARIDGSEFDSQATLAIAAMRSQAEARMARCLITQTLELILDDFPAGEIDLIMPDVLSITSVKYIDTTGAEQTLINTAYTLGEDSINAEMVERNHLYLCKSVSRTIKTFSAGDKMWLLHRRLQRGFDAEFAPPPSLAGEL